MPKPRPVHHHHVIEPLLKMCLECLSNQLVQNCSGRNDANLVDDEGSKLVSVKCDVAANPFEDCPSALLDQIIETIGYSLKSEHIYLLLNKRLTKLNLNNVRLKDESDVYRMLQLAAAKCVHLSVLVMKYFNKLPCLDTYQELLPRFKCLKALDVSFSPKFNDSCMEILGIHCPDLRVLKINYCYEVTDDGIKGLCGGTLEKEMRIGQSGQCKSLRKLSITGTKVTLEGVQMILMHSPHLYFLENNQCLIPALVDMHRPEADNLVIRPKSYALIQRRHVEHTHSTLPVPYKTGDLLLVTPLCLLVTDLNIEVQVGVTDADLLSLVVLETLSKLRISFEGSHDDLLGSITFDGLAPLLKLRGSSLTSLELVNLPVNFGIIVEYCPNLKLLALERCTYSALATTRPKRMETGLVLNCLEELTIEGKFVFDQAMMPTKGFLSSPAAFLKRLSVLWCDDLNDDVIQEVCKFHPFTNLENLLFTGCPFVTKKGIDLFMNEGNALKRVIIRSCELISDEDFEDWKEKVQEKNWHVFIGKI